MKVEIEFNVDNEQFAESKQVGIVKALNSLAEKVQNAENMGITAKDMPVMDENGNKIGTYKLMVSRSKS